MKFVVTGATGFIGREVVSSLLKQGHYVYCVCRPNSPKVDVVPKDANLSIVEATMADYSTLGNKISNADVLINMAWDGITREGRDFTDVQRDNITYALQTMDAAKAMGCKVFVETGSQAEYGIVPGILTENTPCNPVTAYGKGKLKMYKETCVLTEQLGLKYIHLRILSVYGEND